MMSVDEYAKTLAAAIGSAAAILASAEKRSVSIAVALLKAVDEEGAETRDEIHASVRTGVPDATDAEIYEGALLVAEVCKVLPAKRSEITR